MLNAQICTKYSQKRLAARLRPDLLGAFPRFLSWIKGERRVEGRAKERKGREETGGERRQEGEGQGGRYPASFRFSVYVQSSMPTALFNQKLIVKPSLHDTT